MIRMTGPIRDRERAMSLEVKERPAGLGVAAKTA